MKTVLLVSLVSSLLPTRRQVASWTVEIPLKSQKSLLKVLMKRVNKRAKTLTMSENISIHLITINLN